ncbi:MAG: peptidase [Pirellulales bacterium]
MSTVGLWGVLALLPTTLTSQPAAPPHLAYAFPAGARRGETCEIVLGGQYLKKVQGAYVAGGGVKAEIVRWYRGLTPGEYNQLRMALDEAREKLIEDGQANPTAEAVARAAGVTAEQLREMELYRERQRDSKRQPNEQLEEELTIRVTIADDATYGRRELRLVDEAAISNPLWIHVGQYPEIQEVEPNDVVADRSLDQLPAVVNGRIMPGDVDRFSFSAKKGQKLVLIAGAREVIPYLADAVPGWFQPSLMLFDSKGAEIPVTTAFHFHQDPVVYFEVPSDDRYSVQVRDGLHRGREDFVYRLTVGEIPFVTSVFPLGAPWDERTQIQLAGWNLENRTLTTKSVGFRQIQPFQWHTVDQGDGRSVRVPLRMDSFPEVFDKEPNDSLESAQRLAFPAIVNGRIDQPGDEDVFRLSGSGKVMVEVYARRHGSPLDAYIQLTDMRGKELAFNDDYEDKTQGLLTHHADSRLVANVPSSGAWLRIGDTQGEGGSEFVYRVYVRPPKVDFDLRVTPSSILARPGSVTPITVHALRELDFDDDIELALVDAPPGFSLSGAIVPGSVNRMTLTLSIPVNAPTTPLPLSMVGRARLKNSRSLLTRPAVPAEDMMQAFLWRHLVPVEQWHLLVRGSPAGSPPFQAAVTSVALTRSGETVVPLRVTGKNVAASEVKIEVKEPKGITAEVETAGGGLWALKLKTDGDKVAAGTRGNLLLYAYRMSTPAATKDNPNPKPWRSDYGYLPAIAYVASNKQAPPRREANALPKK